MTDGAPPPRHGGLTKAAWNERIKLFATTLNAVGLAALGFGVIGPLLNGQAVSGVRLALSGAIFLTLHLAALWALKWLED